MNEPIFRRALPADWNAILSLLAANKMPLEGAREHLGSFVVAQDKTGLLAYGGLDLYGSVALLRSVVVAEQHRGKRLGQEVVVRMLTSALMGGLKRSCC